MDSATLNGHFFSTPLGPPEKSGGRQSTRADSVHRLERDLGRGE